MNENDKLVVNDCESIKNCIVAYFQLFIQLAAILGLIFIFLAFSFMNGLISSLLGVFIVFIFGILFAIIKRDYAKKTIELIKELSELNCEGEHHAIIIAHSHLKRGNSYPKGDYIDGIDILLEKFQERKHQISYKIYEVESKEKTQEIICNPKTTHLWIFGHGMRFKLQFQAGDLCYFSVRNALPKKFIGQYHCNSYYGKSLADYNKPENYDVTKWPRFNPFIRQAIKRKLIELGYN